MEVQCTERCYKDFLTSKSSHASSSEPDFETDTDEDENEDPGPSFRRNIPELDSDEESELF